MISTSERTSVPGATSPRAIARSNIGCRAALLRSRRPRTISTTSGCVRSLSSTCTSAVAGLVQALAQLEQRCANVARQAAGIHVRNRLLHLLEHGRDQLGLARPAPVHGGLVDP